MLTNHFDSSSLMEFTLTSSDVSIHEGKFPPFEEDNNDLDPNFIPQTDVEKECDALIRASTKELPRLFSFLGEAMVYVVNVLDYETITLLRRFKSNIIHLKVKLFDDTFIPTLGQKKQIEDMLNTEVKEKLFKGKFSEKETSGFAKVDLFVIDNMDGIHSVNDNLLLRA